LISDQVLTEKSSERVGTILEGVDIEDSVGESGGEDVRNRGYLRDGRKDVLDQGELADLRTQVTEIILTPTQPIAAVVLVSR